VDSTRTGLVVPEDDPGQLGEAISRILQDSGLARRMGDAGRDRFLKNLTACVQAEQVMSIYDRILNEEPVTRCM